MDFIHFGDKIFRKEDFQKATMEKDKITIDLGTNNPLIKKCDSEEETKGLMRELLCNLNQSND